MSLVSIIVPTYNRAHLIQQTLDSVAAQSYEPVELIVVDDGSSDDTASVVTTWMAKAGPRQSVYVPSPRNRGKAVVVNEAFERFAGDYVMILDSDDVLLPHAIATEVRFLQQHPEVGMVSAKAYEMIGAQKTCTAIGAFSEGTVIPDVVKAHGSLLLRGNTVLSSTALLRRSVVQTIGPLNPALRYVHDWEYWIRVSQQFKLGFVGVPLLYYRTGMTGASSRNRLGTYQESAYLLMRALRTEPRHAVLRALLFQAKSQARLAYDDADLTQAVRILLEGVKSFARAAFAWDKQ